MKKKYFTLLFLSVFFCFAQAQTTHFIDWETSVGPDATITINVGDEIVWTNVELGMPHDVTSSDPDAPAGFGSGLLGDNDTYSFTFNTAVVFDYGCSFHPGTMDGTITVLGAATCDPPTNLMLNNVTDTTADLSWTASPDETGGYNWAVMADGEHPSTHTPVQSGSTLTGVTNASASGLVANTDYDFFVQTDCGATTTSTWAGPLSFTTDTSGGSDCGSNFYDTGGPGGPYSNNEDIVWTFHPDTPGDVVTVTFTFVDIETSPGTGTQDGCWDFLTVYDGPDITAPIIANTLCGRANGTPPSVPSSLLSIGDSFTSTDPSGAITFRFRSDSSVTLQGWEADVTCAPPAVCDAPTSLTLNNVTDTTADFSWTASPDETGGYAWVVMNMGDDPNTDPPVDQGTVATGVTTAAATGLTPDTMYQAYVKTICDMGAESDFSTPLHLTTDEEECEAITNLAVDSVTQTTVSFSWTEPVNTGNVQGYGAIIVLTGDVPFVDNHVAEELYMVGTTSAMIDQLQPDTTYDLYMASVCNMTPLVLSDPEMVTFTTAVMNVQDNEWIELNYYPNPTSGILTLDARTVIERVEVFTLKGQRVVLSQDNQQSVQLDLSDLSQGIYLLKATFEGGAVKAFRIIKK